MMWGSLNELLNPSERLTVRSLLNRPDQSAAARLHAASAFGVAAGFGSGVMMMLIAKPTGATLAIRAATRAAPSLHMATSTWGETGFGQLFAMPSPSAGHIPNRFFHAASCS